MSDARPLSGRTAIMTGASSSIGQAIAAPRPIRRDFRIWDTSAG